MTRLYVMATAVPLLGLVAMAQDLPRRMSVQDDLAGQKMKAELDTMVGQMKVIGISGAAMGPTVKGAPYSAVEISEDTQVLADGTRIHNQNQTTVYRDSEGRVRRETPEQVTIMDPVLGVSYFLNPRSLTANKTPLSMPLVWKRAERVSGPSEGSGAGFGFGRGAEGGKTTSMTENATFEVRTSKDGTTSVTVNGKSVDPLTLKMEPMIISGGPVDEHTFTMTHDKMSAEMAVTTGAKTGILRSRITTQGKTEALGRQMMEGVNADGTRISTTLEAGAIGNDRPIQMVNERWYSAELQTVVMSKHTDPRTGEETFRLTNVNRGEPGADLFQVPANYQIVERK